MRVAVLSPNASFANVAYAHCTWYVSFVTPIRTDVGGQIRKARDASGLSQVALAERLGVGERTLQSWERNERYPRLDALQQLAEMLGQPVAYFYGDDEPDRAAA